MMTNKTKSERNWVVVVDSTDDVGRSVKGGQPVYLGNLDVDGSKKRPATCGVRRLENAIRYTAIGAMRVLNGWPTAKADGTAYIMQVAA